MTKNGKEKTSPISFVLCAILVLYTVVFLMLLLWALITAVKSNDDFVLRSNFFWLPKDATTRALLLPWEWEWENFAKIIKYFEVKGIYRNGVEIAVPFITQVIYTLLYAGGCSLLQALCPCIVAYATSKFSYRFNRVIELVVLFTMIIPIVGSSMSMIDFLYAMNLYDTFLCLYVQKFYFANMYYLVYSAVFKGVSKEYYEAAHIDGASEWVVMTRISLPLIATSFGLIVLLQFIGYWNDYGTLLVYAPSHPTISYGLYRVMTDSTGSSDRGSTPVQMAGCVLIVIPTMILFLIFRDKLMGNLTIGGVKE